MRGQRRGNPIPALTLAAAAGHAVSLGVADPQGDFIATYAGPHAGDVDVLFAYSIFDQTSSTFTFGATMSAPIGTTNLAQYIWGVDRGTGTARLNGGATPVGSGVKFDAVIALDNLGGGAINLIPGATALAPGAVSIVGNNITVTVAASALPSKGFSLDQYQWNLWPRVGSGNNNNQISDFAPNNSTLAVLAITPVPEPDALAGLLARLGLVGVVVRRRKGASGKG